MDEDRIGLVLARTSELRSKIINCIHKASEKEVKENDNKEFEANPDAENQENERLLNIRDALESLEAQLSSLQGLCVTLISPRFVFVIGNAIIIILFLKSGQLSTKDGEKNSKIDVYDAYMEYCRKNQQNSSYENEKQPNKRKIHRSQSENMERMYSEEPHRELRRSMTEKCRKSVNNGKKPVAASRAKDEMSSEEFRRTVEAFIARQQRCLREEEEDFSAVVSYKT